MWGPEDETKGKTMFRKSRERSWFGENIDSHVFSGNPCCRKSTVRNMFLNEVISNVDVF